LKRGWHRKRAGTRWTWVDRTASPLNGLAKLVVIDRGGGAAGGAVEVHVIGKRGRYGIVPADAPLQAAVVLGQPTDAAKGKCAQNDFSGAECAPVRSIPGIRCAR
jgi:hypothetical protein